jgi:exonuclease VII small subunit
MAAIFQIRRGTSNETLTDGELYLHKGIGSIQFGSGSSNVITLLPLNAPVNGNINLIGNISASGDVRIGGNIYLGDNLANDSVNVNSPFSGSLIPSGSNIFDLGSNTYKYKNVYATSISGAIAATNGVVSGSSQLTILNLYTASQDTKNSTLQTYTASIDVKFTTLQYLTASVNSFTSSQESKDVTIENYTASMNTFTASVNGHITDINTKTGSFESKNIIIESYTSSMNTFTASVNGHISDINTKTGSFETKWTTLQNVTSSILSYTSSLKSAIELTGSSVTILGNLVVKGTQLLVDSTTIQLGDNILELNGTAAANGGLLVKDTTGTSGSLLWDSTNDYWKGGTIGNEEKLLRANGDGVVSGSLDSLNTFSASVNEHITDINTKTSSFESKFTTLETYTASVNIHITDINTKTGSLEAKNIIIGNYTSSMNTFTASQETKDSTLAIYTASVSVHITDINTKTGSFESKFTTLETYTASLDTKNTTLGTYTASINTKFSTLQTLTASVESQISRIQESTASLNTFSASINAFYNNFTASLVNNGFSASVDKRLDDVEYTVISLDPGNVGQALLGINLVTQSLQNYTSSQDTKNTIIESYTSSMNTFTASVNGHITDINTKTGSFETKFTTLGIYTASIDSHISNLNNATSSYETNGRGIVSGSSQITPLLPTGVVSGSSQISLNLPSGVVSGSSQINADSITNFDTNVKDKLNADTVVSGSSQVLGGSTIHSGSSGDYQFNSIGVGTAASNVAGEIRAINDITAFYSSDIRLKENIVPIQNALEKVESISGNTYDWKVGYEEFHSHKGNDIGVIAQEIEQILPQIVTNRDNGYKAVQYEKIVPLLIEAIKELSAKVKELESK